jgi:amino acid transporter
MSGVYPIAGSVYSYAGRTMGESAGFIAGWSMLLDYLLLPALNFIACSIAIHAAAPAIPASAVIVALLVICTAVNLLGIETTARTSMICLIVQLLILGTFLVAGFVALGRGTAGAHLSIEPFFEAQRISFPVVFAGLSLALVSFLGFDAISTLAEEAKDGSRAIGRATLISLSAAAFLFVVQTYVASLFVLGRTAFPAGDATFDAFYDIANTIGGAWLKFLVTVPAVVFAGIPAAVAAQVATARLLYGMARDGKLPRALAYVHPRRRVPDRSVLLVAAVTLALGLLLANSLDLLTAVVNFGALTGFLMLQASVVAHFMWRQKSKNWLHHLVVPLIGFAIIAYVLVNMAAPAKITGLVWLSVGIIVVVALKWRGKRATFPT